MAGWTDYARDRMLTCTLTDTPAPGQFFIALYVGSADPGGSPAELAVDNYARQVVLLEEVTAGELASSADVAFTALGAGTYQGVGLLDAVEAGNLWFWSDESAPLTVPDGATVTFAAGAITVTVTA